MNIASTAIVFFFFFACGICQEVYIQSNEKPLRVLKYIRRAVIKLVDEDKGDKFILRDGLARKTFQTISFESSKSRGHFLAVTNSLKMTLIDLGDEPSARQKESATFRASGTLANLTKFVNYESMLFRKKYLAGYQNKMILVHKWWLKQDSVITKYNLKEIKPEMNYKWGECSVECGGGKSIGVPTNCKSGEVCLNKEKECNTQECEIEYKWSDCTRECGGGTRFREPVDCNEEDISTCPIFYEECNAQACTEKPNCSGEETFRYMDRSSCCNKTKDTCGNKGPDDTRRITGGYKAAEGEWPWMVLVDVEETRGVYSCGGTLLSKDWVVTAAHCVRDSDGSNLLVTLGTNNIIKLSSGAQKSYCETVIKHQDYEFPLNDIALAKLKKPAEFSATVKPLCLPRGEKLAVDARCFAVGWGAASEDDIRLSKGSDDLLEVALKNLPMGVCAEGYRGTAYGKYLNKNCLCGGVLKGNADTCLGDSGGPLMCQRCSSCSWYLAGITSFGPEKCGENLAPGVFVNVLEYESWIESHISSGVDFTMYQTCTK